MATADKYLTIVTNPDGSKQAGYIKDGRSYYTDGTPIKGGASVTDSAGRTWTKAVDDANKAVDSIIDAVQTGASRGGGAGRSDVWGGSGKIYTDTGSGSSGSSGGECLNLGSIFGGLSGSFDLDSGWLSWLVPLIIVILFLKMALGAVRGE